MTLPQSASSSDPLPSPITKAAADWLARRDRGLTAVEQDDYMQWLAADARHQAAVAAQARALERMMQLYEWTPANAVEPNPDLFAPPRKLARVRRLTIRRAWWAWAGGLGMAAAAAVALLLGAGYPEATPSAESVVAGATPASFLCVNERLALPDGSRIELNDGAQVVVLYSERERRVRLTGGEAHFSVWKDASRPFIVEVEGVEVVAVGTAFNVRLGSEQIEVLVTEGKVKVQAEGESVQAAALAIAGAEGRVSASDPGRPALLPEDLFVSMGQRAVVPRAQVAAVGVAGAPQVTAVSADEIATELAWQAPRLQFDETRLADAVTEFNRLNRHQLELRDPALGELRIGGNFRPDNVEGFVHLLGLTLDIQAQPAGPDRTVLYRQP